jgi:hypothetical protein
MPDRTRTEQIRALRAAIARSGLSQRQFARDILTRDPRTVRRWLSGDSPIPQAVLAWLGKPSKVVP